MMVFRRGRCREFPSWEWCTQQPIVPPTPVTEGVADTATPVSKAALATFLCTLGRFFRLLYSCPLFKHLSMPT